MLIEFDCSKTGRQVRRGPRSLHVTYDEQIRANLLGAFCSLCYWADSRETERCGMTWEKQPRPVLESRTMCFTVDALTPPFIHQGAPRVTQLALLISSHDTWIIKKENKRQFPQEWLKNGLWSAARSNPWINPSVDCYSVLQDVWIYLIYKKNKWYADGRAGEDLHCWPLCTCQRCVSTAERTWGCWRAGRAARCS